MVESSDLENIKKLNEGQRDFKLNNIDYCIVDRIIYDGTIPVAYGIVKKMAEAIMLVNDRSPKPMRAKAMRELMKIAEWGAKREHCEQLQCFVSDRALAKLLEKQFGFIRTKDIVLCKEL